MLIFIGYILVFILISSLLYKLNSTAVESLAAAIQLEALNFAAMALMGMVLFFIGKLFFEMRFVQFMRRLDKDLKRVLKDRDYRFEFRQTSSMPLLLQQINGMLDALNSPKDKADALRVKIIQTLETEKSNPGKPSKALISLADEIMQFTHGKDLTNQE